jgi:hypothetical protein
MHTLLATCRDLKLTAVPKTNPCTAFTTTQLKARVTPPGVAVPTKNLWTPAAALPAIVNGNCNTYLPGGATLNRFLWAIQHFVKSGERREACTWGHSQSGGISCCPGGICAC